MLPLPDTKHDWKFDSTRNAWFYMVNGNQRVYYSSTPRNLPPPVAGPAGRQFQPDNVALNYKHASSGTGTLPIPIHSGPTAQPGRGPIVSPNFAGSPQPMPATGFSPNSQSPGAGIFQRQNSLGAPSVSGASPPANFPPHIAGGGGGFSPPGTTLRKVFEQGGGYVPGQPNPPSAGGGRGGGRPGQGGGNQPPPNQFPTGGGRGGGGFGQGRGPGRGGGSSRGGGSGRVGSGPARGGGLQPPPNVTPSSSRVTEEQQEILNKQFQVRKRPRKFFRLGKVFLVVHTENFGSKPEAKKAQATAYTSNRDAFVVAFGELAISKVRRFIVVSEQANSCLALAITTHSGSGAAKKNASDHGIVYTGFEPPPLKNEGVMLATAIRVDPFFKFDRLDVASRVDYSKTYNIEHNVKVKPYGMVNQHHMHHLVRQWTQVIMGRGQHPAQNAFKKPSLQALQALGFSQGMTKIVLKMMDRSTGPSADIRTSITSVARSSAQFELQVEAEEDASEEQKLALKSEAEKLANHVVEFILAGMTYHQAVDRVRQLSQNGNGYGTENAAVGDIDDGEDDDDEEEEYADDD